MRRGRNAAVRLRAAVDMLPIETKQAMLVGLDDETIITGAYTHDGGICPMLAAHRRGGRTDRASFAHPRDRDTGADKGRPADQSRGPAPRAVVQAGPLPPLHIPALSPPGPPHRPPPRTPA